MSDEGAGLEAKQAEQEMRERSKSLGRDRGRPSSVANYDNRERSHDSDDRTTQKYQQYDEPAGIKSGLDETIPTRRLHAYPDTMPRDKPKASFAPVLGEAGYIERNLPGVLKSQANPRFNSAKEGNGINQALMHDLDARFENQDRMINYLIQQLGAFEQTVSNSNRRVSDLQERDRDSILRVRNDLKF